MANSLPGNEDHRVDVWSMKEWLEPDLSAGERLQRIRRDTSAMLSMLHNNLTALTTAQLAFKFCMDLDLPRSPHK